MKMDIKTDYSDVKFKDEALAVQKVSTKVVKIIQSYTGVVNKMVWRKF